MKPRLAILASGEGTTAEAFIRAVQANDCNADIGLVISSRPEAGILQRIEHINYELGLQIQTVVISAKTHPAVGDEQTEKGGQTEAEQTAILAALADHDIDVVLLMGYMKKIGSRLIAAYGWHSDYTSPYQARMLNTHPGLLPATKGTYGLYAQEKTLADHRIEAGQTLHIVSTNYDDGPILAENKITVLADDTAESLFARVQAIEKACLPHDIAAFLKGRQQYILETY